nr:EOG090X0JRY [Sida crystallina]
MEILSNLIRVSLPNYLAALPLPNTFGGWFKLGLRDWISLVPLGATVAGITYLTYDKLAVSGLLPINGRAASKPELKKNPVNLSIKKDEPKVVDNVDVEDIGDKKVFCRCWKSKSFPYCDGSHNQHNASTGDNVGPLIVGKKSN